MFNINRYYRILLLKALLLGMITSFLGILLATTPVGRWLEEEVALSWLFKLRGKRPIPPEVVIVTIDQTTSEQLDLPNKPRKWPRSRHAQLINTLTDQGVAMIAFDMLFEESRHPLDDQLFAEAIQAAGNVVLFQYLNKRPVSMTSPAGHSRKVALIETLVPPIPVLAKAALGLAPFPLPKVPARLNHFILYKPELGHVATLPVLALQVYGLSVYEQFRSLLNTLLPEQVSGLPDNAAQIYQQGKVHELGSKLRRLFLHHPGLAKRLLAGIDAAAHTATQKQTLEALITSYAHPASLYLNFYGPPQTLTTIPYHKVLAPSPGSRFDFKGKAVFVGFAEPFQPDQNDAFYTVYTQQHSGQDVSGVEIAATAFANLLDNSVLTVPTAQVDVLILVLWGGLLGLVLRILPGQLLIPVGVGLGLIYGFIAYQLFAQHHHWIPLAIPLVWQAPFCMMAALLWKFIDTHRERQNIRRAFGYHLPINVVDQLAHGVDHLAATGQHAHGIVLASDAEQYTTLSEQMAPAQLRDLMNRYYETLFVPIRQAGGIISDVVGDAVLAIWASAHVDIGQRQQACQAALDILHTVETLNQGDIAHALPTRLGLHFGELVMGHVGAVDHYEYRAVGDIVNTATRIEGLNKPLGTRIIVSQEVIAGLETFTTRELGRFLLKGKHNALTLYELIGNQTQKQQQTMIHYNLFETALHAFQQQDWQAAMTGFEQFKKRYGRDGPTEYYLGLIQQYEAQTRTDWDGIIRLT